VVFPFLFIANPDSDWGPDCAHPIGVDGDDLEPSLYKLMVVFASVFGAMHFITWSFSMPTLTELWMWRSSSVALTSLPILGFLCFAAGSRLSSNHWDSLATSFGFLSLVCLILHPLIRLAIAVDSVVLLRSLPDTALFVLSWSDAIPSL